MSADDLEQQMTHVSNKAQEQISKIHGTIQERGAAQRLILAKLTDLTARIERLEANYAAESPGPQKERARIQAETESIKSSRAGEDTGGIHRRPPSGPDPVHDRV